MAEHNVSIEMARACRVLAHHEMIDLCGHLSARIPGSDRVFVTPRFTRRCLPRAITWRDLLVCDSAGTLVEGSGVPPAQLAIDLAIYRDNPQRQACIFAAPRVAMAAAIAGHTLRPLTHMESATGFGVAILDSGEDLSGLPGMASRATAVHQPGVGVWAAGSDSHDCLTTLYHLEYLAQANLIVAGDAVMRGVARRDSDKLWSQFHGHHHYREFFASLDPGAQPHPYDRFLRNQKESAFPELKSALAFSCRALWERRTLVAFLEHISHRAPDGRHFLMTASKNFGDIDASDVCLLDYEANSIAGPRPPGFKWFHAQLLRERKDVQAVVHTHDLYGRAYALSERKLVPSYRVGLDIATCQLPVYGRCDLITDPDVRRQTLDALADGPVVHEIGHGTDFVAGTLEKATVDAIQREAFLAMDHLARQFGGAKALAARVLQEIRQNEPAAEDWWWFYTAEVGAPRRSAAGL